MAPGSVFTTGTARRGCGIDAIVDNGRVDHTDDPLHWLEEEHHQPSGNRVRFQQKLAACDRELVDVAVLVRDAITPVTTAFLQADTHITDQAIAADAEVDRRCVRLEDACYALLAQESPVAGDLRRVVAVLHSVQDVQRSGALLRHIAESLRWVHPPSMPEELRTLIAQLGEVCEDIFSAGIDAWLRHDPLAANDLDRRDDQVDLLQKVMLTELYTGAPSVEESVSLALIARYYERIADHGVELARQVAYFLTGERVTGRPAST